MCVMSGLNKGVPAMTALTAISNMIILTKHTPTASVQVNLDKKYSNENERVSCEKRDHQLGKH